MPRANSLLMRRPPLWCDRIFALCAAGRGPSQIAKQLRAENVLCPAVYTYRKLGSGHTCLDLSQPYNWSDSTIANILENETYLGNTVNMKFTTKSYKDKRYVQHPREECLVFEGTHPALITREVWDIVQRVRQNRKRPTKMEELNKYSGLCHLCRLRFHQWSCIGRAP